MGGELREMEEQARLIGISVSIVGLSFIPIYRLYRQHQPGCHLRLLDHKMMSQASMAVVLVRYIK